nr:unnamed protein product [Callosobruchus chinensis]
MVLTREVRDEIKNVVSQSIQSILNDEQTGAKIEAIALENSTVIRDIKEEAAILKSENEYLLRVFDDIDQQSRNKNLRIFNFPEKNGEDLPQEIIRLCNSKLDVPIEKEDIVVCSRIGKKLTNRPRSILLKLAHVNSKQRIYKNKSRLKGSGIVIKEDLSEKRLKMMQVAIEKTSLKQVWSFNGSIYVLHRGKRHVIKNIETIRLKEVENSSVMIHSQVFDKTEAKVTPIDLNAFRTRFEDRHQP